MDAAATSGSDGDGSGIVGEGEREEPEGRASVSEVGERGGIRPTSTGRRGERRGGGSCVARMQFSPSGTCPLGQAKLLAGGVAGLGRQVGLVGGAR